MDHDKNGFPVGKRTFMLMIAPTLIATLALILSACGAPAVPANRGTPAVENRVNDISMELIGQVTNPSPQQSIQYGYLTFIKGIDTGGLAKPSGVISETTAVFAFYSDTTTERVINNGPIRTIDRIGKMTVYFNDAPHGDFAKPDTFRDGKPVMLSTLHHQVVIDTLTGGFTTAFVNTITQAESFKLGDKDYSLGKVGGTFQITVFGHLTQQAPPAAYIAGFASGIDWTP